MELIDKFDLTLSTNEIAYISHWITPKIEKRRYDCEKLDLLDNPIINLGKKLLDAERLVLGVRFFKHATETLSEESRKCLLVYLDKLDNVSGIISIANKFKIKSDLIFKYAYPVISNLDTYQINNLQLVYSIIRQESGFYSSAISRTGALGLMQVMPATAKQVTSDLGIKYSKNRLSSDEIYNIKIGSFYFNKLLKKFKGSISFKFILLGNPPTLWWDCLLYTSDAADE